MTEKTPAEPKGQHKVPASYLAGFTVDGTKTGRLWVTDKARRKQYQGSPKTSGRENHFYTAVWADGLDPFGVEKSFQQLEDEWAPVIKQVIAESRLPRADSEEMAGLTMFVAFQAMRTSAARDQIGSLFHRQQKQILIERLKNGTDWDAFVEHMRSIGESVEFSREELLEWSHKDDYVISADKRWTIQTQLWCAIRLFPHLCDRSWCLFTPEPDACDFVCSDAPVSVTFADGQSALEHGFCERGSVVTVPLGRRHALAGFYEGNLNMVLPEIEVAGLNTMTIRHATQIYSAECDFRHLCESGVIGTSLDFRRRTTK